MDHPALSLAAPIRLNLALLDQAAQAASELGPWYTQPLSGGRSPVGAHFRHVIDHYDCFFAGLETGRIDYYSRKRDPEIQSEPGCAVAAIRKVQGKVADLQSQLDDTLRVDTSGPAGGDGHARWAASSVRRELAFVSSHTLHHLAQIRGMALELGVDLGGDFGEAPSTLAYEGEKHAPAVTSDREKA